MKPVAANWAGRTGQQTDPSIDKLATLFHYV